MLEGRTEYGTVYQPHYSLALGLSTDLAPSRRTTTQHSWLAHSPAYDSVRAEDMYRQRAACRTLAPRPPTHHHSYSAPDTVSDTGPLTRPRTSPHDTQARPHPSPPVPLALGTHQYPAVAPPFRWFSRCCGCVQRASAIGGSRGQERRLSAGPGKLVPYAHRQHGSPAQRRPGCKHRTAPVCRGA